MITAIEARNNFETNLSKLLTQIQAEIVTESKSSTRSNFIVPKHLSNNDDLQVAITQLEENGFKVKETFSTIMDRTVLTIDWE